MDNVQRARMYGAMAGAVPLGGVQGIASGLAIEASLPAGHNTTTSLHSARQATIGSLIGTVGGGVLARELAGRVESERIKRERAASMLSRISAALLPGRARSKDNLRIERAKTLGLRGGMLVGGALGGSLGSLHATKDLSKEYNMQKQALDPESIGGLIFGGTTLPSVGAGIAAYNQDTGPRPGRTGLMTAGGALVGRGAGGAAGGAMGASAGEAIMNAITQHQRKQEGRFKHFRGRWFGRHKREDRAAASKGRIGGAALGSILGASVGGGIGTGLGREFAQKEAGADIMLFGEKQAGIGDVIHRIITQMRNTGAAVAGAPGDYINILAKGIGGSKDPFVGKGLGSQIADTFSETAHQGLKGILHGAGNILSAPFDVNERAYERFASGANVLDVPGNVARGLGQFGNNMYNGLEHSLFGKSASADIMLFGEKQAGIGADILKKIRTAAGRGALAAGHGALGLARTGGNILDVASMRGANRKAVNAFSSMANMLPSTAALFQEYATDSLPGVSDIVRHGMSSTKADVLGALSGVSKYTPEGDAGGYLPMLKNLVSGGLSDARKGYATMLDRAENPLKNAPSIFGLNSDWKRMRQDVGERLVDPAQFDSVFGKMPWPGGKTANQLGMQGTPMGQQMLVPIQQTAAPMMGFGGSAPAVGGQFAGGTAGSAIGAMIGGMLAEKQHEREFKKKNFLQRLIANQGKERAEAGQQGQLIGSMLGSVGGQALGGYLGAKSHRPDPVYMAMQQQM